MVASIVGLGGTVSTETSLGSTGPVLGSAFSAKVVVSCKRALADKKAEPPFPFRDFNPTNPDISKLSAIGRYELKGVQIFRSWLADMLALGQPSRGRTAWTALLDALRAHTGIIADQQAAALRRDGSAFTRDFYAGNEAQRKTVRAAAAAGVPICATAAGA
jgi:hypothetical protein